MKSLVFSKALFFIFAQVITDAIAFNIEEESPDTIEQHNG